MGLIDLIFPKTCLGCGKYGVYVCAGCIQKLSPVKAICPECEKSSIDGMTHSGCARAWNLDGLLSIWPYTGVVRKSIIALKHKFASELAQELSGYVNSYLENAHLVFAETSILVPIPLHWYRQSYRGFNQSEEIGKLIAQKLEKDFAADFLLRKAYKKPQTGLKGKQRRENIRGAYELNKYRKSVVKNNLFIIFDDVYTTGSTLKEAAKVLKRAGARSVWGLTLAR